MSELVIVYEHCYLKYPAYSEDTEISQQQLLTLYSETHHYTQERLHCRGRWIFFHEGKLNVTSDGSSVGQCKEI